MFWRGGVCPWRRRRAYPVANNEDTTSLAAHDVSGTRILRFNHETKLTKQWKIIPKFTATPGGGRTLWIRHWLGVNVEYFAGDAAR